MPTKEQFTKLLTEDLRPVQVLKPASWRFAIAATLSLLVVGLTLFFIKEYRVGFLQDFFNLHFLVETTLVFAVFFVASWLSVRQAEPGLEVSNKHIIFLGLVLGAYIISPVLGVMNISPLALGTMADKRSCLSEVLIFMWVPIVFLLVQLKRGYPFLNRQFFFVLALAGSSLLAALMQLACVQMPLHNLQFHILPAVVGGVICYLLGELFLFLRYK